MALLRPLASYHDVMVNGCLCFVGVGDSLGHEMLELAHEPDRANTRRTRASCVKVDLFIASNPGPSRGDGGRTVPCRRWCNAFPRLPPLHADAPPGCLWRDSRSRQARAHARRMISPGHGEKEEDIQASRASGTALECVVCVELGSLQLLLQDRPLASLPTAKLGIRPATRGTTKIRPFQVCVRKREGQG